MNSFVGSDGNMNLFASMDRGNYGVLDGLTTVGDEWLLESTTQSLVTTNPSFEGTNDQLDISQGSM